MIRNKTVGIVFSVMLLTLMFATMVAAVDETDGSPSMERIAWHNEYNIDVSDDYIEISYTPRYNLQYYDGIGNQLENYITTSWRTPTDSGDPASDYIIRIPRDLGTINRTINPQDLYLFGDNDYSPSDFGDHKYDGYFEGEINDDKIDFFYTSYADIYLNSDIAGSYSAYRRFCDDAGNVDQSEKSVALEEVALECINTFNNSSSWQEKINALTLEKADAEKASEIYLDENKDLQKDLQECSNGTTTMKEERDKFERQYNSCSSDLTRANAAKTDCNQCEEDLANAKKSKNSTAFIAFLAGLAVYHFVFNKKKGGGPSEQEESGSYADSPRYREPAQHQHYGPGDGSPGE